MEEATVKWTDYLRYRIRLRGFDLDTVEQIVRYSNERYFDTATGRYLAVGRQDERLLMIPYDREGRVLTPVTVHATSRRQINFRLRTGRFRNE